VSRTNTPAYFAAASATKKKSLPILTPDEIKFIQEAVYDPVDEATML
jgi:hypothetical protein